MKSAVPGKILVLLFALAACAWTTHNWLVNFNNVSNDPACYIDAAENLVHTGKLFDYGNWVSRTEAPVVEPYTEWPPGTPLFLAPFILVFHDTMLAVIIAQCLLIFLSYAALVMMADALDLGAVLTVALLAAFTFIDPFRIANAQYGSETLFFILSLGAGCSAVKLVRDGYSKKHWIMSLVFTFLASSVRFTGVANIGWFMPLLAPRFVLRRSPDDPTTKLITRAFFAAGLLILGGSVWIDAIGFFLPYRIHFMHFILLIMGTGAFIVGLGFVPGIEARNHIEEVGGGTSWTSRINRMRILALAAAFGPAVIWFARNKMIYGMMTRSHGLFTEFNPQGIVEAPIMLCFYLLQDPIVHQTVLFLLITLLAFMPLMIGGSKERTIGLMLVMATLFQVGTMWGSSLLATFAYLNGRLLSPTILLAVLSVLYGLAVLYKSNGQRRLRYLLLVLPFLFLATNRHVNFKTSDLLSWKVNYPREMYLWREVHKMKWTLGSSQVYTDLNYRHQMFTGIPQKIYWYRGILRDPALLRKLFSEGRRPFLVFPVRSRENEMIRETIRRYEFRVDSVEYPELGYVLYYEPPR